MAQNSITIDGKRITAETVKKQMTPDNLRPDGDYQVNLNGQLYIAFYYYNTDAWYIPDDIAPDGVHLMGQYPGDDVLLRF